MAAVGAALVPLPVLWLLASLQQSEDKLLVASALVGALAIGAGGAAGSWLLGHGSRSRVVLGASGFALLGAAIFSWLA